MHDSTSKLKHASLTILFASISIIGATLATGLAPSAPATETTLVIGTKQRYLSGQSSYNFMHDTSLVFNAPQATGWTFDHIEVDFGCEVGGVTGSNVSSVFTVDNGRIQVCQPG